MPVGLPDEELEELEELLEDELLDDELLDEELLDDDELLDDELELDDELDDELELLDEGSVGVEPPPHPVTNSATAQNGKRILFIEITK